eukprot:3934912-Rhodomonas_salina.1
MDHVYRPPVSALRREVFLIHAPQRVGEAIAQLLVECLTAVGVPEARARSLVWLFDPGLEFRCP